MIVTLETGLVPEQLAALTPRYREGLRWAVYARAVVGPEGFPNTDVPIHAPAEVKAEALRLRHAVNVNRALLFPEGDD